MFFPIGDTQVKGGHFPLFAYGFIGLNVLFFFYQLQFENQLICEYGSIPKEILDGEDYYTLFTSMFMHGGWMHLIGNMLFLWVFADNIEATVGSLKFVLFYLAGGIAASAAHIYFGAGAEAVNCCLPCVQDCVGNQAICSGSIPTVGASGAISAVLGAYLVMFPKSQIKVLVLAFFRSFNMQAMVFLGLWIAMQLFYGFSEWGKAAGGGTAWWAHIGGFVFGVVAGFMFKEQGGIFFKQDGAAPKSKAPKFDKDDFV